MIVAMFFALSIHISFIIGFNALVMAVYVMIATIKIITALKKAFEPFLVFLFLVFLPNLSNISSKQNLVLEYIFDSFPVFII